MARTTETKPLRKPRRFLVNAKGRRTGVVLSMHEYEELVEAAEQLDDIRHLAKGKAEKGKAVRLNVLEARLRAQGKLR